MGGITDAVTSITEAISTAIADVVTWLKSVAATLSDILEWAKGLPAAISQAISTAIADVIEWLKSLGAALADILEWIKSLPFEYYFSITRMASAYAPGNIIFCGLGYYFHIFRRCKMCFIYAPP